MDASLLQFNPGDPTAWQERMLQGGAPEPERIAAAAREFEGVLLRQYLSEALKPLSENGTVFGSGNAIYGSMINDALASGLGQRGVFGFSNLLQAQIAGAAERDHDDTTHTL